MNIIEKNLNEQITLIENITHKLSKMASKKKTILFMVEMHTKIKHQIVKDLNGESYEDLSESFPELLECEVLPIPEIMKGYAYILTMVINKYGYAIGVATPKGLSPSMFGFFFSSVFGDTLCGEQTGGLVWPTIEEELPVVDSQGRLAKEDIYAGVTGIQPNRKYFTTVQGLENYHDSFKALEPITEQLLEDINQKYPEGLPDKPSVSYNEKKLVISTWKLCRENGIKLPKPPAAWFEETGMSDD